MLGVLAAAIVRNGLLPNRQALALRARRCNRPDWILYCVSDISDHIEFPEISAIALLFALLILRIFCMSLALSCLRTKVLPAVA